MPLDPLKIFPQETGFIKYLHITQSCASIFPLCLWFGISLAGGIPLASTQAPAQYQEQWCLIYNQAAASIASCSPHTATALRPSRSPQESTTSRQRQRLAEAKRGTSLHPLNWAN